MKILVTGSNGQLGNELRSLGPSFPEAEFIFTDIAELDITREVDVDSLVSAEHPEVVINCAAYTAVDKPEVEDNLAFLINATAVGNLARLSLIHI